MNFWAETSKRGLKSRCLYSKDSGIGKDRAPLGINGHRDGGWPS
jgi:hypothetical protein